MEINELAKDTSVSRICSRGFTARRVSVPGVRIAFHNTKTAEDRVWTAEDRVRLRGTDVRQMRCKY
jgi:hypothetical protein